MSEKIDRKALAAKVFRPRRAFLEPEGEAVQVGMMTAPAQAPRPRQEKMPPPAGVPLHFILGPGNTGKSFFARMLIDGAVGGDRPLAVAELDPVKRELVRVYGADRVMHPTTDTDAPDNDPDRCTDWFIQYLDWLSSQEPLAPSLNEFGGGSTIPARLVAKMPRLLPTLESAGFTPVAWHFLTGRPDDLSTLADMERLGFQPRATALVFNEALLRNVSAEEGFGRVMAHQVFREAERRGAAVIRMPALDPRMAIAVDRGMPFHGHHPWLMKNGMGGFAAGMVDDWMGQAMEALHPMEDYLP